MDTKKNKYNLLGIWVNKFTIGSLNWLIGRIIGDDKKCIIANHNLHSVYLFHNDPIMNKFYKAADYIHVDGFPLIYMGKILGQPLSMDNRIAYIDWMNPLLNKAEQNKWRIFYLGTHNDIVTKGRDILKERFPTLELKVHHGYFNVQTNSVENITVRETINSFEPNILMVGMGMPRQEKWILENYNYINTNIFLNAGACMDWIVGVNPIPPRWLGPLNLEWLYRLILEPRRLWKRYLIEPWYILRLFIMDIISKNRNL